jgi:hypothetical protein
MKKFKLVALGVAVVMGLRYFVIDVFADDTTVSQSTDVPILLLTIEETDFLSISLFNADELIFKDINHEENHNVWMNPEGQNAFVDVIIDSSRPWTLAIEGEDFVGIENPTQTIGISRLRTRVQRAVLPDGQIIYTDSDTSGSAGTGNQIGASDDFRTLTATGRQQMVVTNRIGQSFRYRMQFQFHGDQDITEAGGYQGVIRYAVWQR